MSPKVLAQNEIDDQADALDATLTEAEEREARGQFAPKPPGSIKDLSDGGSVNGVTLYPVQGGIRQTKGRPTVRQAWNWDGSESMLPLAWDTDGKIHDGARAYLLKRHCLCCSESGFKKMQGRPLLCPRCVRSNCSKCSGGTSQAMQTLPNGRTVRGFLISNFYLTKDDVPFPQRFYGDVDCFLASCVRRGSMGFLTEDAMRVHAMGLHDMQYQAHLASVAARGNRENDSLRVMVNELTAQVLRLQQGNGSAPSVRRRGGGRPKAARKTADATDTIQ